MRKSQLKYYPETLPSDSDLSEDLTNGDHNLSVTVDLTYLPFNTVSTIQQRGNLMKMSFIAVYSLSLLASWVVMAW